MINSCFSTTSTLPFVSAHKFLIGGFRGRRGAQLECVGGHGPGVWLVVDGRERGVEQFQVFVQRAAQQVIALDTRVARVHVLSQRPAIRHNIHHIFSRRFMK